MNQTKIDTLSEAQTPKNDSQFAREEQKGEKRCMAIQTTNNHHGKKQTFKIALVIL